MGNGTSAQSPTSSPRREQLQQRAVFVGGVAQHLNDLRRQQAVPLPAAPPANEWTKVTHHWSPISRALAADLAGRIRHETLVEFNFLDDFQAYYRELEEQEHGREARRAALASPSPKATSPLPPLGWELPPETYNLFQTFSLKILQAHLHPDYNVGTAMGVRVVISDFGLLNIKAAFGTASDKAAYRSGTAALLRLYLEFAISRVYKVDPTGVVVAMWNPGSVAVMCCLEADMNKWTRQAHSSLQQRLDARHRVLGSAAGVFTAFQNDQQKRNFPVTFAAFTLQKWWRVVLQGVPRPPRPAADQDRHAEVQRRLSNRISGVAVPPLQHATHQREVDRLRKWWDQLSRPDNRGLKGDELRVFGREIAKTIERHPHPLMKVRGTNLKVPKARWVAVNNAALTQAGLPVDGHIDEHDDEYSDLFESCLHTITGHHAIQATTAVLELRVLGLAAVAGRDLNFPTFDMTLQDNIRRIVGAPADLDVRLLSKRYGSVQVFLAIDTVAIDTVAIDTVAKKES